MKNDNTQSRANKKFNPMSCVLRNYIIKILDHPRFTEISNSKVPGKLIKNISMITDKIIFVMTELKCIPRYLKDFPMSTVGTVSRFIVSLGRYYVDEDDNFLIPKMEHLSTLMIISAHAHHLVK